ncbi:P-loop containing nucleoside triphosphate hydrolase protein [Macrolepiota fuliginosa MF-IS2]|uniref:P-loop containing nucleoside triphosphate hydrolase protein n=1 Tax=Macrolepiota fuliginosa MF-IS2 TaxID=1400762 RepID=A0A9P5XB57_9AGAR|nr:P-loop containing nucleoside triphosphate hydrolase protein [Macrolepiota fuliginosa MF-IS2]
MPPRRDINPSGLGRAIINRKVKDARRMQETGNYSVDVDTTSRLKSITQERDLDEFFNTAELAGTEFTAERRNVKIIQQSVTSSQNPYLLTEQEEANILKEQEANKKRLRVPRRPPWTKVMTPTELDRQEKAAFLEWRRGLAELQEAGGFLLTPFERNIEVWRQLWRVLERSHLVVQIVDARNPLKFRCEDLEDYIQDVEGPEGEAGTGRGKRKSLLLINKADLLTAQQRCHWADYFESQGIRYAFFSAANAAAIQQARKEAVEATLQQDVVNKNTAEKLEETSEGAGPQRDDSRGENDEEPPTPPESAGEAEDSDESSSEEDYFSVEEDDGFSQDSRARVLSVLELEDLLLKEAPLLSEFTDASGKAPPKLNVGLVGYPNVGKSSTINSLLGEKKVSVSSTPGKTKHFQTIHLSDSIVLCDCPGLVFPQFATTKADLICDGVLPIDQMREYTAPISLLVKRIPKEVLEAIYGLSIKVRSIEDGGDGKITGQDFLIAYAIARGYMRSSQGNPDEARAARYILKDYVNAKLLFCHPPPSIEENSFNEKTRQIAFERAAGKKKAPVTRVGKDSDTFVSPTNATNILPARGQGTKSNAIDDDFFRQDPLAGRPMIQGRNRTGQSFSRAKFYPHQNAVANDGTPLDFTSARISAVLENAGPGKKLHKKMKRVKQRSGKGYD